MHTLYLEEPETELRYERACLLVYRQGSRIGSVPLRLLERVVAAPHVALTAGVLGVLAKYEVGLLVLNERYPERCALLSGTLHGDVHRRMRQYERYQDEAFRAHQSLRLVRLKVGRQYRLLDDMRALRPDLRHPLAKALTTLQGVLDKLAAEEHALASLRGLEGAAAAAYFKAFSALFAPALGFVERNRRPPKDPVNVCLSLAYTLAYHEAVNALKAVGLDSAIGCFHDVYYRRDSLACDLLEPVRPWLDAWVYRLFHERVLRAEDFKQDGEACLLLASGKQRFYEAYREQHRVLKRLLRGYARFALQEIMQDAPAFEEADEDVDKFVNADNELD